MFAQVRDPLAAGLIAWLWIFGGWLMGTEVSLRQFAIWCTGFAACQFATALFIRFGWPRIQAWRNRGKGWSQQAIEDFQKGEPK